MDGRFAGPAGDPREEWEQMSPERLIDEYGDGILRLCVLILGDWHLAEDAFQITMTKAWKQRSTYRGESGVKTWLSRIAANTCRDMLRSGWFRLWRKSEAIDALPEMAAPGEDDRFEVRDAVLALPGKYREVIAMYYFEDMKLREIAEALRLPVHTVSTRLRRARGLLAQALAGEVTTR